MFAFATAVVVVFGLCAPLCPVSSDTGGIYLTEASVRRVIEELTRIAVESSEFVFNHSISVDFIVKNFTEIAIKNFAGIVINNTTKFDFDHNTKFIFDNTTGLDVLVGRNVCTRIKNYKKKNVIIKYEIHTFKTQYMCLKNWKFLCSFVNETLVPIQTEVIENIFEILSECCLGYEITPNRTQCRPFCKDPCVWGTCISPNICKCEKYYGGHNCRDRIGCSPGKFGFNCTQKCQCQNNATCNYLNGSCICKPGNWGKYCEGPCPFGYYGDKCQLQCKCQTGAQCDPVNGACYCLPGYTGTNCEIQCPPGFYGYKCQNECKFKNGTKCDSINGKCSCLPEYETRGSEVNDCDCQNGTLCNSVNETCTCQPGLAGKNCKFTCPPGFYGKTCSNPCKCKNNEKCDPVNGDCYCNPGYTGKYCSLVCPSGFYGYQCQYQCKCQNGAQCNPVNGVCACPSGLSGKNCLIGNMFKYDGENNKTECSCNWRKFDYCEPFTGICKCKQSIDGVCVCKAGWTGNDCETLCTYGENCKSNCIYCQNGAKCRAIDGSCICEPGFYGPTCSEGSSNIIMNALQLDSTNNEAAWIFDILVILSFLVLSIICVAIMMCYFYCSHKCNLGHVSNVELQKPTNIEPKPNVQVICTSQNCSMNRGNLMLGSRKPMTSYTNEIFYENYARGHRFDDDTGENLYLEIDESTFERAEDLYDHLDFLRPTTSWKPHYQSAMVLQEHGGNSLKKEDT